MADNARMRKAFVIFVIAVFASFASAQAPKSAEDLVSEARAAAAKSGKVNFIRFTASWCGWCHRMDGVLSGSKVKPIWDKYFVSTPIVVLENGDKEKLENPGGEALMESVGGKNQGIPFFYFVDAKTGKMITNSMRPAKGADKGGNVGCPYAPEEIAFFMDLLRKAAPKMTATERSIIENEFKALSKKASGQF